jgi:hypothetical protein
MKVPNWNEEQTGAASAIGEMHIIVMSKKELAQLIKSCSHKTFVISTSSNDVYTVPNWKEQNCKIKCNSVQAWYEVEIE